MANIVETDNWPGGVYQYADGDELDGGPDSAEVLPFKQLAQRSLYQRLRNVTDWDAGLAAAFGYPAGAVVRHAGVSWRAIAGNDVEPGTDPLAWERWGFSESELATYLRSGLLSPATCPATGPAAPPSAGSPYTLWKSVAPYNEYWGWLGDTWGVVWSHWADEFLQTSGTVAAGNFQRLQTQWTMHRPGRISVHSAMRLNAPASGSGFVASVGVQKNGVWIAAEAIEAQQVTIAMIFSANCAALTVPVVAGDLIQVYFRSVYVTSTIEYGQSRIQYVR